MLGFIEHCRCVKAPVLLIDKLAFIHFVNDETMALFETEDRFSGHASQIFQQDALAEFYDKIERYTDLSYNKEQAFKWLMQNAFNFSGQTLVSKLIVTGQVLITPVNKAEQEYYLIYLQNVQMGKQATSNVLLTALTRISPIPVIGIDIKGRVLIFNNAAQRVFQYRASEVVGKNIKMLMVPEIAQNHDYFLQRYVKTGVKTVLDKVRRVPGKRKDGAKVDLVLLTLYAYL